MYPGDINMTIPKSNNPIRNSKSNTDGSALVLTLSFPICLVKVLYVILNPEWSTRFIPKMESGLAKSIFVADFLEDKTESFLVVEAVTLSEVLKGKDWLLSPLINNIRNISKIKTC